MELFRRRYLCFLAFVFLLISLTVYKLPANIKLTVLIVSAVLTVASFICLAVFRTKKFKLLMVFLTFLISCVSVLNSFVFITLPLKKALEHQGRYSALIEVISLQYSDEDSSEYNARLLSADGAELNIKSYIVCNFNSDFLYGDRIAATVDSEAVETESNKRIDKDILLFLRVDDTQPIVYSEARSPNVFSVDALRAFTRSLRNNLCEYIDGLFGEDSGLVKGMLINEKSDISTYTKSQFNRSGASHLLAVSGLHISLLLGTLELLLKRLLFPKKIRIACVMFGGVILLALTDFSASASRAVLMMFSLYLNYMLSEESDAPTALFAAVALIIFFSPFSVGDIGMWLSFAATLGVVSVYPFLEGKLPRAEKSKNFTKRLLRLGIGMLKALLLTLVANIFVLPLMWYFFGSISLVSLPCNLLLSPLSAIFLPLCFLSLIFGKLGAVGNAVIWLTKLVGGLILRTVGIFADLRGAVISLEYPFAKLLIIAFSLSMAILMVIRLKRKLLICLPTLVLFVSFAACLCLFNLSADSEIRYLNKGNNEVIFAERAGKVSVCDMTDARSDSLIYFNMPGYSVEIENYIITLPQSAHPKMLERLYENTVIRNLYIPITSDIKKLSCSEKIYETVQKYNTNIIFYHSGESLELFDDLLIKLFFEERGDGEYSVFFSFYNSERILTYTDSPQSASACAIGARSRYFLVGCHGEHGDTDMSEYDFGTANLIFANENVASRVGASHGWIPEYENGKREFEIIVE